MNLGLDTSDNFCMATKNNLVLFSKKHLKDILKHVELKQGELEVILSATRILHGNATGFDLILSLNPFENT